MKKEEKSMSILITGGTGYIGINLAIGFLKENKKVILLGRKIEPKIVSKLKEEFNDLVQYYSVNLLDEGEIRKVFEKNRDITSVLHCASNKKFKKDDNNLASYYQNNISTTITLLNVMRQYQVKHIIFSSSASIYEKSTDCLNQREDMELIIPKNSYGKSKYIIEEILKDIAETENDWKIDILRIFNPIGILPFFDKESGYEILKKANNLMTNIALVASGEKEKIDIYVGKEKDLNKVGIRDYISMSDLFEIYKILINGSRERNEGLTIYNAGTRNKVWYFRIDRSISRC